MILDILSLALTHIALLLIYYYRLVYYAAKLIKKLNHNVKNTRRYKIR